MVCTIKGAYKKKNLKFSPLRTIKQFKKNIHPPCEKFHSFTQLKIVALSNFSKVLSVADDCDFFYGGITVTQFYDRTLTMKGLRGKVQ